MADDWKPGDLALCVRGGRLPQNKAGARFPKRGAIYHVARHGVGTFAQGLCPALWFDDAPMNNDGQRMWGAVRFIKVTPQSEDAFDREVIAHMAGQEVENA